MAKAPEKIMREFVRNQNFTSTDEVIRISLMLQFAAML